MSPRFPDLPPRLGAILLAVLEEYVETARPVSSRRAASRSGLRVSPATVRAGMADLTERGLLTQPHSSAGRVPTEHAFRLFVDDLLQAPEHGAEPAGAPLSLERAMDELSRATGQLAFGVNLPGVDFRLSHLHFVRVSSERVMAILISTAGVVQNRLVEEARSSQRELDRMSALLSTRVGGLTLGEARARLAGASQDAADQLGEASLAPPSVPELHVGDRQRLLLQPEFADADRLRDLLSALEEKERMLALLDGVLAAAGTIVRIGHELPEPGMQSCALVTSAGVGIIGPVRMRYDLVIPVVREVGARIQDALAR